MHQEKAELRTLDLFDNERDGYTSVRIPAIVVTKQGSVLAFAVGRTQVSDWSASSILMRRSTDAGETWSPSVVVAQVEGAVVDNPVPIVDTKRNCIHLLYQTDYNRCYYTVSTNDGMSFASPRDITETFERYRPTYNWTVIAPGPGHGIMLDSGRLVVPIWMASGVGKAHRPSCIATVFSDDGGANWHPGEIVVGNSEEVPNPSETVAVQLGDGRVMLNIRNESRRYRRAISTSRDGATNWSAVAFDEALYEPICCAGLVRTAGDGGKQLLVFTNPAGKPGEVSRNGKDMPRTNLTVRISYDDGKTWPLARTIEPEMAGYSDVATGNGYIYCLYEHGQASEKALHPTGVRLAQFTVDWVAQGKAQSYVQKE